MSTASPSKFVREYQPKDEWGNPVGPIQHFEADTLDELADKLAAAHQNASLDVYKSRKALKLGILLDPDPAEAPILTFQETPLTADERIEISNALGDPNQSQEAVKRLLKSYGIPVDSVREMLQEREIEKRINRGREETEKFLNAHPEYVHSDENRDLLLKYLEKRKQALTKKNLEIAYEDLTSQRLLIVQAPQPAKTEVPTPAPSPTPAPAPAVVAEVPPAPAEIPPAPTAAPPISDVPQAPPRPAQSASGLGRENTSATPTVTPPKAKGITAQDITRMSASDYAFALQNGLHEFDAHRKPVRQLMTATEFKAAVEELHKR